MDKQVRTARAKFLELVSSIDAQMIDPAAPFEPHQMSPTFSRSTLCRPRFPAPGDGAGGGATAERDGALAGAGVADSLEMNLRSTVELREELAAARDELSKRLQYLEEHPEESVGKVEGEGEGEGEGGER